MPTLNHNLALFSCSCTSCISKSDGRHCRISHTKSVISPVGLYDARDSINFGWQSPSNNEISNFAVQEIYRHSKCCSHGLHLHRFVGIQELQAHPFFKAQESLSSGRHAIAFLTGCCSYLWVSNNSHFLEVMPKMRLNVSVHPQRVGNISKGLQWKEKWILRAAHATFCYQRNLKGYSQLQGTRADLRYFLTRNVQAQHKNYTVNSHHHCERSTLKKLL